MSRASCRACGGPSYVARIDRPEAVAVTIRLTVAATGWRRSGEFALCPRCGAVPVQQGRLTDLQAALLAELLTLLR